MAERIDLAVGIVTVDERIAIVIDTVEIACRDRTFFPGLTKVCVTTAAADVKRFAFGILAIDEPVLIVIFAILASCKRILGCTSLTYRKNLAFFVVAICFAIAVVIDFVHASRECIFFICLGILAKCKILAARIGAVLQAVVIVVEIVGAQIARIFDYHRGISLISRCVVVIFVVAAGCGKACSAQQGD